MIVVVGSPAWGGAEHPAPTGLAASIASAVAAAGSRVELVGRIGDDDTGDQLLIALTRRGVGHVAVLRDPARPTRFEAPTAESAGGPSETSDDELAGALADASAMSRSTATSPLPVLDAADVALGLSYLSEFGVLVLLHDLPPEGIAAGIDAAAYAGAELIVLVGDPGSLPAGLPRDATVLAVTEADPGDSLATVVASYAVALDSGVAPEAAFAGAVVRAGWEQAPT